MISTITNKESLSAYLGATLNIEADGLTGNADHIFGLWVNQGFEDSKHYLPHILQGGLGMPDRDNYIDPSPKPAELRARYQAHIAAILKLGSVADPNTSAARVLALETAIARSHAPDADAADVFKQNNPWKRVDFGVRAPGMDWDAYFRAAGLAGIGLAIGIAATLAGGRVLTRFLFDVRPTDPVTLAATSLIILLVAVTASLVPALRAAKVDPAIALRAE